MFVYTGESYRNIDTATEIRPVVSGTRCSVFVRYPDLPTPICITGPQANGVLEYVLRRRVSSASDALDVIFKRVEEEATSAPTGSGNGVKPRKKRVLRDPEASRRRMSEAALKRWAKTRERAALEGA